MSSTEDHIRNAKRRSPFRMSYFDRNYEMMWYIRPRKKVCPTCRITFARNKVCPNCHKELIPISYRACVPKKNASNSIWKKFWKKHNDWCKNYIE